MVYYRFDVELSEKCEPDDQAIGEATRRYNSTYGEYVALGDIDDKQAVVYGAFLKRLGDLSIPQGFLQAVGLEGEVRTAIEVTASAFFDAFGSLFRHGGQASTTEIATRLGVSAPDTMRMCLADRTIRADVGDKELLAAAAELMAPSLDHELQRILSAPRRTPVAGHPVHYIIRSNDSRFRSYAREILLQALSSVGRLSICRHLQIETNDCEAAELRAKFELMDGGAVSVIMPPADEESGFGCKWGLDWDDIGPIVSEFCHRVLVLVEVRDDHKDVVSTLEAHVPGGAFVAISGDAEDAGQACAYLEQRAQAARLQPDEELRATVSESKWTRPELDAAADAWISRKLRKTVYTQYSSLSVEAPSKRPESLACDELQALIGLDPVKEAVSDLLAYRELSDVLTCRGANAPRPMMHMAFLGNPGTAKTTVARLFARIAKERRLVRTGVFVETGRSDLVGQYVGPLRFV